MKTVHEDTIFEQSVTFMKAIETADPIPFRRKFYVIKSSAQLFKMAKRDYGLYYNDGVPKIYTTIAGALAQCAWPTAETLSSCFPATLRAYPPPLR